MMFRIVKKGLKYPEAKQLLLDMKKEFTNSDFPLKRTYLRTVNSLLDVINHIKPINSDALKNASLLDDPNRGNPIVKAFLDMGVSFTDDDLRFIKKWNKEAAEFMQSKAHGTYSRKL